MSETPIKTNAWLLDVVMSFATGLLIGTVMAAALGARSERIDCEREAVKAGVAEYVADAEGRPKFTWKTKPEK